MLLSSPIFLAHKLSRQFFNYLDASGGFFYERWGDAPVSVSRVFAKRPAERFSRRHSIAATLFLPADQLHQFDDIGYRHNPYTHCPSNPKYRASGKCSCSPSESFDTDGYSCMRYVVAVFPG